MKKDFTSFLFFIFYFSGFSQTRYLDSVFNFVKHTDIQYGSNYDSKNNLTPLLMDIYEPESDTAALRPIIFFVHGGSFVGGSRTDQSINKTAEYFSQKGYVTANIEYRVEQTLIISPYVDFGDPANFYKAIARVTHDLKAAIRYFKKDAALNGNSYKVDTSKIFIYGSSAGAIGGLITVFLDDTVEMSARFKTAYKDLGGLDGNSGNPGYDIKGIKAMVSCSGAVDNVNYLENNTDIAYLGFHNSPDFVVPYDIGCFTTVFCHLGYFYGDNRVAMKARSLGMNMEFHTINKAGHPVDAYDDTSNHRFILQTTSQFLYKILNPDVVSVINRNLKSISIYPNPSDGNFTIEIPKDIQSKDGTIEITDMQGKQIYTASVANKTFLQFYLDVPSGIYLLSLKSEKQTYLSKISIVNSVSH
ncbi:MAG: Carboxylesterase type [Bacteroidota bacterium]|nr:Carboxylesterase type [Bacteroidota bacterium]